ncbi:hypothetical protein, partial [Bifidobacterium favimelis]
SVHDYEDAWSRYKQCMVDLGHVHTRLAKFPNGVYYPKALGPEDMGNEAKITADDGACQEKYVMDVRDVYGVQVGNPGLWANQDDAIADCLKRAGKVPKDYTADRFLDDMAALRKEHERRQHGDTSHDDKIALNLSDGFTQGCMVANAHLMVDASDPNNLLAN